MEFMGIINATPDSFHPASRVSGTEQALELAKRHVEEGATLLDIGGESSRPGAAPVTPEEECQRVIPVIKALRKTYPDIKLSVDTYHAYTAEQAILAGVDIINDISAMTFDPDMVNVIKKYKKTVILMHVNGRPDHMQDNPTYQDVVKEVYDFLDERIRFAEANGIHDIIIDLGIGFGKTKEHNLTLLRNLDAFAPLHRPMLLAVSRKSCLDHTLEQTVAWSLEAARHGVEMARVHDVAPNKKAVDDWMTRDKDVVLAFGSNLGDRRTSVEDGIRALSALGSVGKVSALIETKPYGVTDQPDFLNGALLLKTKLTPQALLPALKQIEKEVGRIPTRRWGPRVLDLDIIYYEDLVLQTENLIIPHVDRCNRSFVLNPIAEIAPDLVDPQLHKTVKELQQELQQKQPSTEES